MKLRDFVWPAIGLAAVIFSSWILYHEVRGLSLEDILVSFQAIAPWQWAGSIAAALCAYLMLGFYDRLALRHLHRVIPFPFVLATSFTTYALAHNIGASVFSGAVVRYRAYKSKGLPGAEVAVLIAFCSITFTLGVMIVAALALLLRPDILSRYFEVGPGVALGLALLVLALVGLYVAGGLFGFKPLQIGKFRLEYPDRHVIWRQIVIAPTEIVFAGLIIYFALPPEFNPGPVVVIAIFVASFTLALVSHAPGGLGVLEVAFLTGLHDVPETDVLAALFVFRILYLLVPFAIAIVAVLMFEHSRIWGTQRRAPEAARPSSTETGT